MPTCSTPGRSETCSQLDGASQRCSNCGFNGCGARPVAPHELCLPHRCGVEACVLPVIEEGAEFCWLHQLPNVYVWQCMSQLACARHAHLRMAVDGCPFCIRDARRCEERGTWRVLQPRNARVLSKVALVCDGCAPYVDEIGRCFHVDSLGIRCPTPARIGTHACARHRCQEWITREGQSTQCEHAAQACSVNEPVLVCGQHDRRSISNDPEDCERVSLPVSSIPVGVPSSVLLAGGVSKQYGEHA